MKELRPALLMTLLFVVLTGLIFPGIIWAGAQLMFHFQANGSLLRNNSGAVVGSVLIGQPFSASKYFHPRPSAAGSGYDPTSSGGTNLGPISAKLIEGVKDDPSTANTDESFSGIKDLARGYREENSLAPDSKIPADAATRSASGLDPEISPQNAFLQAARIANARGIPVDSVKQLINEYVQGRFLGLWGEPRVNVLLLNLELDSSPKR